MALTEEERCATCGAGRPAERTRRGEECGDPYHAAAWPDSEDETNAGRLAEIVRDRLLPPMTVQISRAEQDHHAMLRQRSYELAIQRGHIRR